MINKNNHVFLIAEIKFSNANDLIKKICKSFLSDVDEKEYFFKKIDDNNYYDYIEFDLYLNEIKVDDIKLLKKNFYSISLESAGYKFYVIKNIELLNEKIANSLLKFIEDPPSKTIAIFTTRNLNKILPTIYSRCEEIKSSPNIQEVYKYLERHNKNLNDFYLNSFYSINEIISFDNCKNRNNIIELYESLRNDLDNEVKILYHLDNFKKLSYKEIGILVNSLIIDSKIENKKFLLELLDDLKYNLSKTLLFNKILNLIK